MPKVDVITKDHCLSWHEWMKAAIDAWVEAEKYGEQAIMAQDGITIQKIHENYLKQHLDMQLRKRKEPQ